MNRLRVLAALIVCCFASSALQAQGTIVSAGNEQNSIDYLNYQSATITSAGDGLRVWSFTIIDDPDGLPTEIVTLTIYKHPGDQSNWSVIRKGALFYQSNDSLALQGNLATSTQLYFDIDGSQPFITVPDGGSVTIDLRLTFNASVTDNKHMQFTISDSAGFGSIETSTPLAIGPTSIWSSSVLTKNKISVTATRLRFPSTPNFVNPNNAFSMTVQAVDSLDNVDLDATYAVGLAVGTGAGVLTGNSSQTLVAGEKTFSALEYNLEEWPVTLVTTNGSGLTNGTSDQFEVSGALLIDDFKGVGDADLTDYGWAQAQSGTPKAKVAAAGLTKSGYASSGRYLAATIASGSEHVYRNLVTSQTSNYVYLSFMISFGGAPSSVEGASELIGFATASPSSTADYFGLFSAHASGGNIRFGVSKTMGETAPTWTGYSYTTSTVYLIVLKYTFESGTDNDRVDLFIDPSPSPSEPSPTLTHTPTGYQDAGSIGSVVLIQQTGMATMTIDGIRVSTSWNDALLPVQLASFSASPAGLNARLSWSTASETNNAGFEIERREIGDLRLSSADYHKVGFVPGAGTSTSPRDYSYTDANLAPGRYAYRIKQVDRDGSATFFREAEVEIGLTAKAFTLNEAFPNPFNPATSIDFSLADAGVATVKVYDVLGREVATIFDGAAEAGRLYRATWDASSMPSGMYFARLESGGMSAVKRLLLAK